MSLLLLLNDGFSKGRGLTSCAVGTIKDEKGQPKGSNTEHQATIGLPTGGDSYGSRALIIPKNTLNGVTIWGRRAAVFVLFVRNYSTGCATDSESIVVKRLRDLYS